MGLKELPGLCEGAPGALGIAAEEAPDMDFERDATVEAREICMASCIAAVDRSTAPSALIASSCGTRGRHDERELVACASMPSKTASRQARDVWIHRKNLAIGPKYLTRSAESHEIGETSGPPSSGAFTNAATHVTLTSHADDIAVHTLAL